MTVTRGRQMALNHTGASNEVRDVQQRRQPWYHRLVPYVLTYKYSLRFETYSEKLLGSEPSDTTVGGVISIKYTTVLNHFRDFLKVRS